MCSYCSSWFLQQRCAEALCAGHGAECLIGRDQGPFQSRNSGEKSEVCCQNRSLELEGKELVCQGWEGRAPKAKGTGRVGGLGEGTAERAPDMQATSRREGFILRTWVFFSKQPLVALREVGNRREVEAK